jgi:hypothetical protein
MSKPVVRANMSARGSYVSIAGSLTGADEGVKHLIKMSYTTGIADIADPMQLETKFATDHVLIDVESLIASDLNIEVIVKDCDFVKKIALENPEKLKQMIEAYTSSPTGFQRAATLAKEIGLTEEAAIKAGGGAAWLAGLLIIALLAKACEDASNGNPQGKPNPDLK